MIGQQRLKACNSWGREAITGSCSLWRHGPAAWPSLCASGSSTEEWPAGQCPSQGGDRPHWSEPVCRLQSRQRLPEFSSGNTSYSSWEISPILGLFFLKKKIKSNHRIYHKNTLWIYLFNLITTFSETLKTPLFVDSVCLSPFINRREAVASVSPSLISLTNFRKGILKHLLGL